MLLQVVDQFSQHHFLKRLKAEASNENPEITIWCPVETKAKLSYLLTVQHFYISNSAIAWVAGYLMDLGKEKRNPDGLNLRKQIASNGEKEIRLYGS